LRHLPLLLLRQHQALLRPLSPHHQAQQALAQLVRELQSL
jgi:hypothetical protein